MPSLPRSAIACLVLLVPVGCGKKPTPPTNSSGSSNAPENAKTANRGEPKSSTGNGQARGSKTPDRALPRLEASVLTAARKLLDGAKQDYNDAIKENRKPKPDKEAFFLSLNHCKEKLDEADRKLEPVTMWEEDSTMNDWRVSADEDAYLESVMPLIARIDKLRSAAEKISRAR